MATVCFSIEDADAVEKNAVPDVEAVQGDEQPERTREERIDSMMILQIGMFVVVGTNMPLFIFKCWSQKQLIPVVTRSA